MGKEKELGDEVVVVVVGMMWKGKSKRKRKKRMKMMMITNLHSFFHSSYSSSSSSLPPSLSNTHSFFPDVRSPSAAAVPHTSTAKSPSSSPSEQSHREAGSSEDELISQSKRHCHQVKAPNAQMLPKAKKRRILCGRRKFGWGCMWRRGTGVFWSGRFGRKRDDVGGNCE